MQARLLQAVAGLAIGFRDLYLESEMTRGILVAAARRANLLRSLKAHGDTPFKECPDGVHGERQDGDPSGDRGSEGIQHAMTRETAEELEARWHRWLEEEEKRRLGWGIYVSANSGGWSHKLSLNSSGSDRGFARGISSQCPVIIRPGRDSCRPAVDQRAVDCAYCSRLGRSRQASASL